MSYQIVKAPLIIDPDWTFLNELDHDPMAEKLHPWLAADRERALQLIKSESGWISCVIINPVLGPDVVGELMQACFEHIFGAQIFFICDPAKSKKENESRAMVTRQILEKPKSYGEILEYIAETSKQTRKPKEVREKGKARKQVTDEEFSSVTASSLLINGTLSMDLYVKLRANRYVRIVGAGDALDDGRLQRYLKRGLTDFYLKKSEK
ncbi:MAG: hypothetical protein EOP06_18905, partial [Proteobacteria bacterium]